LKERPFQSPVDGDRPFARPENEGCSTITAEDQLSQALEAVGGKMVKKRPDKVFRRCRYGCVGIFPTDAMVRTIRYGLNFFKKPAGNFQKNPGSTGSWLTKSDAKFFLKCPGAGDRNDFPVHAGYG
jgi:hypothetical protein